MKTYLIILLTPILLSCSFAEKNNLELSTILQINSDNQIDTADISRLKNEINLRLSSHSFSVDLFSYDENLNQITIESKIPENKLEIYNSLFEKHTVGFWNTYLVNDNIFKNYDLKNIEIEGFQTPNSITSGFTNEVIGYINNEDDFDSVRFKLKEYFNFIPSLEFYYIKMNSMESSNEFGIYMINTENSNEAPISNKYIIKAKKQETQSYPYKMIYCELNEFGSVQWEKMTEKAAFENRKIAIIFDEKLVSCPAVYEKISGGKTSIVGFKEDDDLDEIARILCLSPISHNLKIVNQEVLSEKN